MFRVLQLYCTVHCTVYIVHFSIEGLESGDGTFEWVKYTNNAQGNRSSLLFTMKEILKLIKIFYKKWLYDYFYVKKILGGNNAVF